MWIEFMWCARQFPCSEEDRLMGRDCGKVEMREAHHHFVSRKGWSRLWRRDETRNKWGKISEN